MRERVIAPSCRCRYFDISTPSSLHHHAGKCCRQNFSASTFLPLFRETFKAWGTLGGVMSSLRLLGEDLAGDTGDDGQQRCG